MVISCLAELESVISGRSFSTGFVYAESRDLISFATNELMLHKALGNPNLIFVLVDSRDSKFNKKDSRIIPAINPRALFVQLHNKYIANAHNFNTEIHPSAQVSPNAVIEKSGVFIDSNAYVGPFVHIASGTHISSNVRIESGCSLGADSLYESRLEDGRLLLLEHKGSLLIDSGTHISQNCVIGKGLFLADKTEIGHSNAIGPLTKICHGVKMRDFNFIGSGVVISGYTLIGNRNFIGPNATIANNLTIGDENQIAMGSAVFQDITSNNKSLGRFRFHSSESK
jgi:UDP-3-O-[3-hydroxymyristoyl] glucosamine N-acyltransferase